LALFNSVAIVYCCDLDVVWFIVVLFCLGYGMLTAEGGCFDMFGLRLFKGCVYCFLICGFGCSLVLWLMFTGSLFLSFSLGLVCFVIVVYCIDILDFVCVICIIVLM